MLNLNWKGCGGGRGGGGRGDSGGGSGGDDRGGGGGGTGSDVRGVSGSRSSDNSSFCSSRNKITKKRRRKRKEIKLTYIKTR